MDDALEPNDGEQSGREASEPCQGKDGEYDQTLGPSRVEERRLHLECWAGRAGGRHHAPTLIPLSLPRPG